MNVLVTGGTGFIGFHFATRLIQEGYHVRALVRSATDASALTSLGVEIARGDIRDLSAVEHAITNCQLGFHLAARTSHSSLPASVPAIITIIQVMYRTSSKACSVAVRCKALRDEPI